MFTKSADMIFKEKLVIFKNDIKWSKMHIFFHFKRWWIGIKIVYQKGMFKSKKKSAQVV